MSANATCNSTLFVLQNAICEVLCELLLVVFVLQAQTLWTIRMDARPNHTIYINNLNEKIKKDGILCVCVCVYVCVCNCILLINLTLLPYLLSYWTYNFKVVFLQQHMSCWNWSIHSDWSRVVLQNSISCCTWKSYFLLLIATLCMATHINCTNHIFLQLPEPTFLASE